MKNDLAEKKQPKKEIRCGDGAAMYRPNPQGLVSIIIPVFNVRPYLVEALDSVLAQTYTNLEIIIIDDGSTDGSGEICDEYAEKDARVQVIHQENKGLSNARNVGLDRMTGETVVFLDPDDAYHPDYVNVMTDAMLRENVDLVICRYSVHHTGQKMKCGRNPRTEPSIKAGIYDRVSTLQSLAEGTINASVWNKLYTKELWDTVRFLDGHVYEDGEASFKITNLCHSVCVLDSPLYLRRIRKGSITATPSLKNLSDYLLTLERIDSFMDAYTPEIFSEKQRKKTMHSRVTGMIVFYIHLLSLKETDRKSFCKTLRHKIVHSVREFGLEDFELRTKAAYWMLLNSPCLLKLLYPMYRTVRLFARRVMEC